jgi:2-polyprenyl-6-methoxyphenol hydroxylase-like FAD-dependent oxidoreductase
MRVDAKLIGKIPTDEHFRKRFGNPYAVIHRVDIHLSLLEGAQETGRVEFFTNTRIEQVEQDADGVTVTDQNGKQWKGAALIGADGVKSVVRAKYVNDPPRVTGHVVYRAVVDKKEFPDEAASGTPPASGSARTATWCTTPCAAASSTTSS